LKSIFIITKISEFLQEKQHLHIDFLKETRQNLNRPLEKDSTSKIENQDIISLVLKNFEFLLILSSEINLLTLIQIQNLTLI